MGDAWADVPSDRGSIPLSSTLKPLGTEFLAQPKTPSPMVYHELKGDNIMVILRLCLATALPVIVSVVLARINLYLSEQQKEISYKTWQIIVGAIFGCVAMISTEISIHLGNAMINVRDAAPICAGLFFGAPAGVIAGLIGGVGRYFAVYWGAAYYTRLACSIATIVAGILSGFLRKYLFENSKPIWYHGAAATTILEIFHMMLIFLTNSSDVNTAFTYVQLCTIPMVVFNTLSVTITALLLSPYGNEKQNNKTGRIKLAENFSRWLSVCVVVSCLAATGLSWRLQTSLSLNNTIEQLNLNIQDVKDDINAASDKNLLRTTESITRALSNLDSPSFDDIARLCKQYNVAEINIVNSEGIIVLSSNLSFKGYNMASGSQSAEFLVLLDGKTNEYVQEYGPISSDETMFRKYAGVVLEDGGFVQVAYDGKRLQEDISGQLVGITKNRRIGEDGCIIIADKNYIILSDRHSNDNVTHTLEDIGINVETLLDENSQQLDYSLSRIHDEPSIYTYDAAEGYYIIGVMPQAEALFSREVSSYITFFMQTVIYGILFILISFLIKHLIGDNLEKINQSLKQITEGDLDVIVNVRNNAEFVVLSDSINATVVTLKHYIDEASEKMEQELKLAKDIQYSSLPNVFPAYPNRKEFDIYALMDTAKEVGGDFYDFYMLGDKHLAFLIADVSGKGIPAALFMMRAKTVIKSLAEAGNPVNDVFTLSNKKLCENNDAEMFVTGWMGILNLETGIIEYANAGHNPPLVRKKNGNFEYLKTRPGFVLGGMEGVRYKKNEFQLEPGDEIFLYTDGVTEATNKYDALYSEERLQNFMNSIRNADCETLCRMIRSDIDRFVGTAPQFDDITMLSLKYKGGPEYEKNHN